jgi:hypothetical protein
MRPGSGRRGSGIRRERQQGASEVPCGGSIEVQVNQLVISCGFQKRLFNFDFAQNDMNTWNMVSYGGSKLVWTVAITIVFHGSFS